MTIWPYHPTWFLLLAVSTNPWEKETITIYLLFQVPRTWVLRHSLLKFVAPLFRNVIRIDLKLHAQSDYQNGIKWFPGRAKDYDIQGGEYHSQKIFFWSR